MRVVSYGSGAKVCVLNSKEHRLWQICQPEAFWVASTIDGKNDLGLCLLVLHIVKHSDFRLLGLRIGKHSDLCQLACVPGNTLTVFCLFYYRGVSKNDVLNLFFDTPRSLFAHNLSKVYGGATLVREISPEIRMRCKITLPSELSPQKRKPRAQSNGGRFCHQWCLPTS